MVKQNKFKWLMVAVVFAMALGSWGCDEAALDAVIINANTVLESSANAWPRIQEEMAKKEIDWREANPGAAHSDWWLEWVIIDTKYRASHNEAVKALDLLIKYKDKPDAAPAYQHALTLALSNFAGVLTRTMALIDAWKVDAPAEKQILEENVELIKEVA